VPAYTLMDIAVLAFVVIPILLVAALAWGITFASRRTGEHASAKRRVVTVVLIAGVWMTVTWVAAANGVLRRWEATPPPFALFAAGVVLLAFLIAFSSYGKRLAVGVPLWALVAVQGFRLPLELAMHAMYERGIMPEQMSYSGRNFDVVTGATAIVVAALARGARVPRWVVAAWNVAGLALLINVVTIAIMSTPRLAYFGADRLNVWVTYPPFVWLPAVMVVAALAGHLLIFRALRISADTLDRSR
jgi:hypothetical protein